MRVVQGGSQGCSHQMFWSGSRVPAPFRHCAEWHRTFVFPLKRLQTCYVSSERESAISKSQRRKRIHTSVCWVVTSHECFPIDRFPLFTVCQCSQSTDATACK